MRERKEKEHGGEKEILPEKQVGQWKERAKGRWMKCRAE
jgi:hypothetical protein